MNENRKNNHEADGGVDFGSFVRKPCGRAFTAIRTVVMISCMKNPICGGAIR